VLSTAVLVFSAGHLLSTLPSEYRSEFEALNLPSYGLVPTLLGATVIIAVTFWSMYLRVFIRERETAQLRQDLINGDWVMNYNPQLNNAQKRIQFLPDGRIGEGSNENETSWTASNELLTLWRMNGDLQNKFRYDTKTRMLASTNEPTADAMKRGIRDQLIFPAEFARPSVRASSTATGS